MLLYLPEAAVIKQTKQKHWFFFFTNSFSWVLLSFRDWQNASPENSQAAHYCSCIKKTGWGLLLHLPHSHHSFILLTYPPPRPALKGDLKNKPQDKEIGEKKCFQHLIKITQRNAFIHQLRKRVCFLSCQTLCEVQWYRYVEQGFSACFTSWHT